MLLGFSSGATYKFIEPISVEAIDYFKKIGCNAIEINSIEKFGLESLNKISKSHLESFEFISMHSPTLTFEYKNNDETKYVLEKIETAHKKLNFDLVIFHPDRIVDWEVLKNFDIPIAIENMDNRKNFGKSVADIENVLAENNYKMVLDIQHIYTNDKSMKLAQDFFEKFYDRIAEIHLSGYDETFIHYPLHLTGQLEIIKPARGKSIPVIIESAFSNPERIDREVKAEYEYVKKCLVSKI